MDNAGPSTSRGTGSKFFGASSSNSIPPSRRNGQYNSSSVENGTNGNVNTPKSFNTNATIEYCALCHKKLNDRVTSVYVGERNIRIPDALESIFDSFADERQSAISQNTSFILCLNCACSLTKLYKSFKSFTTLANPESSIVRCFDIGRLSRNEFAGYSTESELENDVEVEVEEYEDKTVELHGEENEEGITTDPVQNAYTCHVCKKALKTPVTLKQHLQIHIDDPSLICKYCSKKFNRKYYLNLHIGREHGATPKRQVTKRKKNEWNGDSSWNGKGGREGRTRGIDSRPKRASAIKKSKYSFSSDEEEGDGNNDKIAINPKSKNVSNREEHDAVDDVFEEKEEEEEEQWNDRRAPDLESQTNGNRKKVGRNQSGDSKSSSKKDSGRKPIYAGASTKRRKARRGNDDDSDFDVNLSLGRDDQLLAAGDRERRKRNEAKYTFDDEEDEEDEEEWDEDEDEDD